MAKPITIFISYAHKDAKYLDDLQTFLKPYIRSKIITTWTDKGIVVGQAWDELIKKSLDESEIILFLVSPDFLASDYIDSVEIKRAIENNKHVIVSILIRPITMDIFPLRQLQIIPTAAKPITQWADKDTAWNDVIGELGKLFNKINPELGNQYTSETLRTPIKTTFNLGDFSNSILKIALSILISACIVVFFMGVKEHDAFFIFSSLAGLATGMGAYVMMHKVLNK